MTAMVYTKIRDKAYIITGVEAESLGGAEHKILDNFRACKVAQADDQSKPTAYFFEMCGGAEMMSMNEFEIRYNAWEARNQQTMNEALHEEQEIKNEIANLERQLEEMREALKDHQADIEDFMEATAIERRYTAPEKIEAAIKRHEALKGEA
mgnify:CR=1 FL=1